MQIGLELACRKDSEIEWIFKTSNKGINRLLEIKIIKVLHFYLAFVYSIIEMEL